MYLTQPAPTPRGYLSGSTLYVPPVRARLLRSFHDGFKSSQVRGSKDLQALEETLLSNSSESHPIFHLCNFLKPECDNILLTASEFIADLLALTTVTEENKTWRSLIRQGVCATLRRLIINDASNLESLVKILLSTPLDGGSSTSSENLNLLSMLIRKRVKGSIPLAEKIFQQSTDSEMLQVQRSNTDSNIVLALAEQVLVPSNEMYPFTKEPGEMATMRASALHAISVALSVTVDPLPVLLLRKDQTDKTVGQKAFIVLFQQLLYEEYIRKFEVPKSGSLNEEIRLSSLKDSVTILSRAGALISERTGSEPSPPPLILDEYACLIPALFGIIRSLISSKRSAKIDGFLNAIQTGDLLFIKELSIPGIVGTCFELERSLWGLKSV